MLYSGWILELRKTIIFLIENPVYFQLLRLNDYCRGLCGLGSECGSLWGNRSFAGRNNVCCPVLFRKCFVTSFDKGSEFFVVRCQEFEEVVEGTGCLEGGRKVL